MLCCDVMSNSSTPCYRTSAYFTLVLLQGASRTAPEASQVKQDAAALAAAEKLLAGCGDNPPPYEQTRRNTIITCRRMLLELASIKVICCMPTLRRLVLLQLCARHTWCSPVYLVTFLAFTRLCPCRTPSMQIQIQSQASRTFVRGSVHQAYFLCGDKQLCMLLCVGV